jgi:hypothetical protein
MDPGGDCGMGREFGQQELEEESLATEWRGWDRRQGLAGASRPKWWKSADQCKHHPLPGTHPMIVTTENDWRGW